MKIKDTITQRCSLFAKEIHRIEITDIHTETPESLYRTLRSLFGAYGVRSRLEAYITVNNVHLTDGWNDQKEQEHFLKGFELAMRLQGVDVTKQFFT